MTVPEVEAIIAGATFLVSVGTSLFVAGRNRGKLEAKIDGKASREEVSAVQNQVENKASRDDVMEVKSQLNVMSSTLGEIKGMFVLTLKKDGDSK